MMEHTMTDEEAMEEFKDKLYSLMFEYMRNGYEKPILAVFINEIGKLISCYEQHDEVKDFVLGAIGDCVFRNKEYVKCLRGLKKVGITTEMMEAMDARKPDKRPRAETERMVRSTKKKSDKDDSTSS
jgi:hypothetical protein